MLLEFLAIIIAGVGAGGVARLADVMTGRRLLPDWIIPAAVGAGMLFTVIYLEYSWPERAAGSMPEGTEIATFNQQTAWYRPWSFVWPLSNRLIAVDHRVTQRHPAHPDLVLTGVILRERWAPAFGFQSVFDCAGNRRADVTQGTRLTEDGAPEGVDWYALSPDDPVLRAACDGG
jgi:hypothetical protein